MSEVDHSEEDVILRFGKAESKDRTRVCGADAADGIATISIVKGKLIESF